MYADLVPEAPAFDQWPLTVRGPLSTNSSRVVTFARAFTYGGRLYIAESPDKGKTIRAVSSYPIAEDAVFDRRGSKAAKFNGFTWSGCGCSSQWQRWSQEQLVALDQTPAVSADGLG